MNKHQSVYINTIFLLLIFLFTAATVIKPQDEKSEAENRPLQMRPAFTVESLLSGKFATDYEKYLSDQFIGRNKWITLKTGVERAAFKQDISDVYFAKDDYLIEKHTGVFTTDTARRNAVLLGQFFTKLSQTYDSSHLTAMVVPNAVDILRDKLPAFADPYDEENYLSEVKAALPEGVWFDTSAVLNEKKAGTDSDSEENLLYYRTDHHWKTLSACYVYEQWLRTRNLGEASIDQYTRTTVTDSFEGTISSKLGISGKADSIERFDPDTPSDYYLIYNQSDDIRNTVYQKQALDTKDKYAYFYGGNYGLIEAVMPDAKTGRKLLIIKDSYAHCFAPFTYADFDEVDMLDPRYYNSSISQLMASKQYTDVLFLFNASGFAEEPAIARLAA